MDKHHFASRADRFFYFYSQYLLWQMHWSSCWSPSLTREAHPEVSPESRSVFWWKLSEEQQCQCDKPVGQQCCLPFPISCTFVVQLRDTAYSCAALSSADNFPVWLVIQTSSWIFSAKFWGHASLQLPSSTSVIFKNKKLKSILIILTPRTVLQEILRTLYRLGMPAGINHWQSCLRVAQWLWTLCQCGKCWFESRTVVLLGVWVFVCMGAVRSLGETPSAPRLLSAGCVSAHSCAAQAGQPHGLQSLQASNRLWSFLVRLVGVPGVSYGLQPPLVLGNWLPLLRITAYRLCALVQWRALNRSQPLSSIRSDLIQASWLFSYF